MNITDKHIVITGGASGIGLALLEELQETNDISVIARPSDGLTRLKRTFPQVAAYEADFADIKSVERVADALVKSERPVDILINNAAMQHTPQFLDDDFCYESIQREIDINFTSICALIYLLMPSLLRPDHAMIVNINSGLALVPKTSSAIYCATKGALNILSQSLRHQLAETNVEVKQVFLPLVETAMSQRRSAKKTSRGQGGRGNHPRNVHDKGGYRCGEGQSPAPYATFGTWSGNEDHEGGITT